MDSKQNKRLARQIARDMLDWSASKRCIAEISERAGRAAARKVVKRITQEPKPEPPNTGRLMPPHRSGGQKQYVQLSTAPISYPWWPMKKEK